MKKPKSFEDAMQRLEAIVNELEAGGLPLEKSLEKYKEGLELTNYCSEKLNKAESELKELIKNGDTFSLEATDL